MRRKITTLLLALCIGNVCHGQVSIAFATSMANEEVCTKIKVYNENVNAVQVAGHTIMFSYNEDVLTSPIINSPESVNSNENFYNENVREGLVAITASAQLFGNLIFIVEGGDTLEICNVCFTVVNQGDLELTFDREETKYTRANAGEAIAYDQYINELGRIQDFIEGEGSEAPSLPYVFDKNATQIIINPNPISTRLVVDHNLIGQVKAAILDVNHRLQKQYNGLSSKFELDLSFLTPGLYQLKLQNETSVQVAAFVKKE